MDMIPVVNHHKSQTAPSTASHLVLGLSASELSRSRDKPKWKPLLLPATHHFGRAGIANKVWGRTPIPFLGSRYRVTRPKLPSHRDGVCILSSSPSYHLYSPLSNAEHRLKRTLYSCQRIGLNGSTNTDFDPSSHVPVTTCHPSPCDRAGDVN